MSGRAYLSDIDGYYHRCTSNTETNYGASHAHLSNGEGGCLDYGTHGEKNRGEENADLPAIFVRKKT